MNIGFIIISYGNNFLENCIQSIRLFYSFPIFIVDNNIADNFDLTFLSNYPNINYIKNNKNSFELGAIWCATKNFGDIVDKFIILHNSIIFTEKLPDDFINKQFSSFWKTISSDYSPTINWVENKLKDKNIFLEYDKIWYSITGCCCIIETKYLKQLIGYGFDDIYATIKFEAVGTEILFGYLISNILNIENTSLFNESLDYYMRNNNEFKFLKKIGGGQGSHRQIFQINLNNINIFNKIFLMNFRFPEDDNERYIDLINEIDKDENIDIQNFLINTNECELLFNDSKFNILPSIRHRMFTKKYFPTYYQIEKQNILSRKLKLF